MKSFKSYWNIKKDFTGICKTIDNNVIRYYKNGLPHQEDGPATIYPNGDKRWYIYGTCHREAGPAEEYKCGYKYFIYKNFVYYDAFSNNSWIDKVKELKRKEELKIFK